MGAQPGWYPDERVQGREWFWDGTAWSGASRSTRRPTSRIVWGIVLLAISGVFVLNLFAGLAITVAAAGRGEGAAAAGGVAGLLFLLVITAALAIPGVLLLRPEGEAARTARLARENAAARAQAAQQAAQRDAQTASSRAAFDGWIERLALLGSGGAAVVALRNATYFAEQAYGDRAAVELEAALARIGFDRSRLDSFLVGRIRGLQGVELEVFQDYVIYGQRAEDVDERTSVKPYLDGQIQVTTGHVALQGVGVPFNQRHDGRQAEIQVLSDRWAIRVPIDADDVNEARRIAEQLARHVERLAMGLTDGDVDRLVRAILNASGQSPAQKVKELSNLRFDRLLSDEEFEQAKRQVLDSLD